MNTLAGATNCAHVVDVGAGQGHLSRILAFGYGLDVTTVEAVDCHAPKAKKFDRYEALTMLLVINDHVDKKKIERKINIFVESCNILQLYCYTIDINIEELFSLGKVYTIIYFSEVKTNIEKGRILSRKVSKCYPYI